MWRVQHVIITAYLSGILGFSAWWLGWEIAVIMGVLLIPAYWQIWFILKEEAYERQERAGVSGAPSVREAADREGDKPERAEE